MSEEQLAALAARGDRAAMEELAARVYPIVHRFYIKLTRDPTHAQDMTQAAMLHMLEKLHQYRAGPGSKFTSWLFRLSYNLFIDQTRKRRPVAMEDEALAQIPDRRDDYRQRELRDEVEGLLQSLSEEMRAMVVLRYYLDQSHQEIAGALGISEKRVKWRLHDALERMRREAGKGENHGA